LYHFTILIYFIIIKLFCDKLNLLLVLNKKKFFFFFSHLKVNKSKSFIFFFWLFQSLFWCVPFTWNISFSFYNYKKRKKFFFHHLNVTSLYHQMFKNIFITHINNNLLNTNNEAIKKKKIFFLIEYGYMDFIHFVIHYSYLYNLNIIHIICYNHLTINKT